MAVNLLVVAAQAAGFVSLLGSIRKHWSGDVLSMPQGMINIGGLGAGYILRPVQEWNPFDPANNDGSFVGLEQGDDVYIYAVARASGIASWVASKNSAYPLGESQWGSRKVGGFHFGYVRDIAHRYDVSYSPPLCIVPNSCWDLLHRPTCDPSGMVEIIPGRLWADIYLNSEGGGGSWPENIPLSRCGAMPIVDIEYRRSDFHQLISNAGKRFPTVEEFLRYAEGAPAGLDDSNDLAWSALTCTGPALTGSVIKAVSQYNVVDTVGNVFDWLDCHHEGGNLPYAWDTDVVDVGMDASIPRGSVHHERWSSIVGGGSFLYGSKCGARCLWTDATVGITIGDVGFRGVCESA